MALAGAVVAMVLLNIVPVHELYDGIDWSIVVLLGAMIPIGAAMQDTGATALVAKSPNFFICSSLLNFKKSSSLLF